MGLSLARSFPTRRDTAACAAFDLARLFPPAQELQRSMCRSAIPASVDATAARFGGRMTVWNGKYYDGLIRVLRLWVPLRMERIENV